MNRQDSALLTRDFQFSAGSARLRGILKVPSAPRGFVLFAHGTGSDRNSSRNNFVADALLEADYGSLLIDLLQESEDANGPVAADFRLLADRFLAATTWLQQQENLDPASRSSLGYFGASTGAAVALIAAAREPERVQAIVSRGGRTDLAFEDLERVLAPTLLFVGGEDPVLIANEDSQERFSCRAELSVVPGATHLFQEPGALDEVANRTRRWLDEHLIS